ncbi:hypothetical protein F2Q69_00016409 [Brassica cretica]|uniref:Uncharacterized protein n=1 Tax=Brassica cretica TaxID=69181 RepID=A0A8S9R9R5_BRACR|nr:hypothetical protein F2Q69_00016409 [Brassica cretica]
MKEEEHIPRIALNRPRSVGSGSRSIWGCRFVLEISGEAIAKAVAAEKRESGEGWKKEDAMRLFQPYFATNWTLPRRS